MTDTEDPMFSSRTNQELERSFESMMTVARNLGSINLEFDLAEGDERRQSLIDACEKLHAEIERLRAERPEPETPEPVPEGSGPGLKRLRADPRAEEIRCEVQSDQEKAKRAAGAKRTKQETDTVEAATEVNGATPPRAAKKAAKVAKNPSAKTAKAVKAVKEKAAKGAKTAKAAPKKAAPKKAAKESAVGRAKYDDGQKITWLAEGNPYREGSGKFERMEAVRKANGKTIKFFKEKGGVMGALHNAVKAGNAKVD